MSCSSLLTKIRFLFLLLVFASFTFVISSCNLSGEQNQQQSPTLNIATAANAQFAIQEIAKIFEKKVGIKTNIIVGSSGKLTAQIMQGAPYDLLLSANIKYPKRLYQDGYALKSPTVYAKGQLVLWTLLSDLSLEQSIETLKQPLIRKIGIANPKNAPYGEEAIRALQYFKIYEEVKDKLVYGESIAQTTQFIATKNCEIGITAKSIVSSSAMKGKGKWVDVPLESYQPIQQGVVITKYGTKHHADSVEQFFDFLFSEEAQQVFVKYGYFVEE